MADTAMMGIRAFKRRLSVRVRGWIWRIWYRGILATQQPDYTRTKCERCDGFRDLIINDILAFCPECDWRWVVGARVSGSRVSVRGKAFTWY